MLEFRNFLIFKQIPPKLKLDVPSNVRDPTKIKVDTPFKLKKNRKAGTNTFIKGKPCQWLNIVRNVSSDGRSLSQNPMLNSDQL